MNTCENSSENLTESKSNCGFYSLVLFRVPCTIKLEILSWLKKSSVRRLTLTQLLLKLGEHLLSFVSFFDCLST